MTASLHAQLLSCMAQLFDDYISNGYAAARLTSDDLICFSAAVSGAKRDCSAATLRMADRLAIDSTPTAGNGPTRTASDSG